MVFPFANQQSDAGVQTPALPTTGGTAAGSVGAAVPLPWMALAFALTRPSLIGWHRAGSDPAPSLE